MEAWTLPCALGSSSFLADIFYLNIFDGDSTFMFEVHCMTSLCELADENSLFFLRPKLRILVGLSHFLRIINLDIIVNDIMYQNVQRL